MNGPATTTQELSQFITSCLPPPDRATSVKNFSYTNYLVDARDCGNADIVAAAAEEKKLV